MERYDAIILGAGGAGLMCAAQAAALGARVIVIDHAEKPGKKILISGGGRCNFTNTGTAPERFISDNPHFAKSALGRYTADDFIDLVRRHGIAFHEKTLGQLFCDGSARQIVAMLMAECTRAGARIRTGTEITSVEHADGLFRVNATLAAPNLVIATGGPSIPKMGATGFAYDLARRFGLGIVTPRPALVPLTLGDGEKLFRGLSGVATDTIARAGGMAFREASLFTHRGLSGPAILQISSYWQDGAAISLNLLPDLAPDWLQAAKRAAPKSRLRAALAQHLPNRLAEALATRLDPGRELGNVGDKDLAAIAAQLGDWPFTPTGSEGFAKAEVTRGGVDTAGLSSKTMAAKSLPGLFVIGEAADVTGWLGGYNFQWAWSSGWAAGQAIGARI